MFELGRETPHRQNFTFHSRVSQPHLISLPSVCGVSPLSNRPPKHKLAVKDEIIKSSGFFDYEISMNYSEATDGNIFSLHPPASVPGRLRVMLLCFSSIDHIFGLISSSPSLSFPSCGMSCTTVLREDLGEEKKEQKTRACNTVIDWC